jgi:hypothetical protein
LGGAVRAVGPVLEMGAGLTRKKGHFHRWMEMPFGNDFPDP